MMNSNLQTDMNEVATEDYRSREVVGDDKLQTLLNSLTLDQIRTAISVLSPAKKIALKSHRDALDALARTGQSVDTICQALLTIEAGAPFKRCVFSRLLDNVDYTKVEHWASIKGLESEKFQIRVSFVQKFDNCISITLEHLVPVAEWVRGGDIKRIERNVVRHPIVLRLYTQKNIAAFFYPGFSQGSATERTATIEYPQVISDAMDLIGRAFSVRFSTLPSKECIKVLLEGASSRVRVVQSEVEASTGRVTLSAAQQKKSVEEVLADYLGAENLPAEVRSLILDRGRKALGQFMADAVTLYWFDEQVVTRLHFWEIGTDMIFVWHGVPNSFRIVEEIVGLFRTTYEMLPASDSEQSPLQWLSKLPSGVVVRPADFAAQFSLSVKEGRADLLNAMKIGLVQPVYRLRTNNFLVDTPNDWTPDPVILNRLFQDAKGATIDGSDLRNIEVAFVRVETGENA
jgi:hypothetical protein